MAISNMDQLVAALAAAQHKRFYKTSTIAKAAGTWVSFWKVAGEPGAGSNPATGTGEAPTSSTQGAIPWANPSGANIAYLARLQAMGTTQSGILVLADRLFHVSGLVGNVATVQNVNSVALTRPDSTGDNNELWIEWYTATGSSQVNITIAYTNQAGNASTTTIAFYAAPIAGQMIPVALAAGDTGVRSIQSVQLSATTGTAGNFGLTILRRLGEIFMPVVASGDTLDAFALGMPQLDANSCLFLFMLANATTTGDMKGGVAIIQA